MDRREEARAAELEAALLADPGDEAAWRVYADWLQASGDPRGELMAVQHALETATDPAPLREREAALFAEHAAALLGPFQRSDDAIRVEWRRGFIAAAHVHMWRLSERDAGAWLRASLTHPSARRLRELQLHHDLGHTSVGAVEHVMTMAPPPPIVALGFGSDAGPPIDLGALSRALPRLERLRLRWPDGTRPIPLGALDLPSLKELRIAARGVDATDFAALYRAGLPALDALFFDLGAPPPLAVLAPILDGTAFPHLARFGVFAPHDGGELAEALVRSRLLPRLVEVGLDLYHTDSQHLAAVLDARRAAFAHARLVPSVEWDADVQMTFARILHGEHDRTEEALAILRRIREVEPDHLRAGDALAGILCYDLGRADEAVAIWRDLAARDPELGWWWRQIGWVEENAGRWREALAMFERAVACDPEDAGSLYDRGRARLEAGDDERGRADLRAAVAGYTESIERYPSIRANHLYARGAAYARLGERSEALADLAAAVELDASQGRQLRVRDDYRRYLDDPDFIRIIDR